MYEIVVLFQNHLKYGSESWESGTIARKLRFEIYWTCVPYPLPWDSFRLKPLDCFPFVQFLQYTTDCHWSLLYTSQVYFFNHGSKSFRPLELEGVTSFVDWVKCVPLLVLTHPMGSWKLNDYNLASYLVSIVRPISTNQHTVKDSFSFSDWAKHYKHNEIMCYFDVCSCRSCPLSETVSCLDKLYARSNLLALSISPCW